MTTSSLNLKKHSTLILNKLLANQIPSEKEVKEFTQVTGLFIAENKDTDLPLEFRKLFNHIVVFPYSDKFHNMINNEREAYTALATNVKSTDWLFIELYRENKKVLNCQSKIESKQFKRERIKRKFTEKVEKVKIYFFGMPSIKKGVKI